MAHFYEVETSYFPVIKTNLNILNNEKKVSEKINNLRKTSQNNLPLSTHYVNTQS